jgi:hypothetical protein
LRHGSSKTALAEPWDLFGLDEPYPGFAIDRDRLVRGFAILETDPQDVWYWAFWKEKQRTDHIGASNEEVIEATMLLLIGWLNRHPILHSKQPR